MNFTILQILVLSCLIKYSGLAKPNRIIENLQENLGRISEAIRELKAELPENGERPFRNRQRFGRTLNRFNHDWPLIPPHFRPFPPPNSPLPDFRPDFRGPPGPGRFDGPGPFERPFRPWRQRFGPNGRPIRFGPNGRPFRRRRPWNNPNNPNNPNNFNPNHDNLYETTPFYNDYEDEYDQTSTPYYSQPSTVPQQIPHNRNYNKTKPQSNNHNNYDNNNNNNVIYPTSPPSYSTSSSPPKNNNRNSDSNNNPKRTRKPTIVVTTTPSYETNYYQNDNNRPAAKNKLLVTAEKICGLRSAPRIVGGREVDRNSWTFMAALIKTNGQAYCGGVLITTQHVLTAAHCLKGQTPNDMFVRLGEYNFDRDGSTTAEDHEVEYFVIHSKYDKFTHENDIAILSLKEKAQFTHFIRPVCLPKKNKNFTNEIATVIGYGSTKANEPSNNRLREVSVPVWKNEDCSEAYSTNFSSGQLCAGFREGGKDSCQGDSGGPLMVQGNQNKWQVIGIVSFGIGCGQKGYPGVYTSVSKYLDWIIANVN